MRLLLSLFPLGCYAAGAFLFLRFGLDRAAHARVQRRASLREAASQQHEHVPLQLGDAPSARGHHDRRARSRRGAPWPGRRGRGPSAASPSSSTSGSARARSGRPRPRSRPPASSRAPKPPTSSASLRKRHMRWHSQPRSSIGSPTWQISQSSAARRPSAPTIRLPLRKSPWTTVRRAGGGGRSRSSARSASVKAGEGWSSSRTSASTARSVASIGSLAGRADARVRARRVGRVQLRERLAALAREARAERRVGLDQAQHLPRDRLARDARRHEEGAAHVARRRRTPRARAAPACRPPRRSADARPRPRSA